MGRQYYFFCEMGDECRRFLTEAQELCLAIRRNLDSGRIKVLTICLTPDEGGFSGGWASSEAICAEFCRHLGIHDFALP
ncbi:hypothetical protein PSAC2689_210006 [Paraburkholderia sacchari]